MFGECYFWISFVCVMLMSRWCVLSGWYLTCFQTTSEHRAELKLNQSTNCMMVNTRFPKKQIQLFFCCCLLWQKKWLFDKQHRHASLKWHINRYISSKYYLYSLSHVVSLQKTFIIQVIQLESLSLCHRWSFTMLTPIYSRITWEHFV